MRTEIVAASISIALTLLGVGRLRHFAGGAEQPKLPEFRQGPIERCFRSRSRLSAGHGTRRTQCQGAAEVRVKAPQGAPNVIVFLIDDIGFGHASTFGGPIPMPTLDHLASQGLKYNRFHTTALCSPTRMALLTGRNHHTNNAGAIMELATAFPGQHGRTAAKRHAAGRDSAPERLQHGRFRQVSRDGRRGKSACPDRSIAGRRIPGSTSSMASSAARPTSGLR